MQSDTGARIANKESFPRVVGVINHPSKKPNDCKEHAIANLYENSMKYNKFTTINIKISK
jgi:hypothetical protein